MSANHLVRSITHPRTLKHEVNYRYSFERITVPMQVLKGWCEMISKSAQVALETVTTPNEKDIFSVDISHDVQEKYSMWFSTQKDDNDKDMGISRQSPQINVNPTQPVLPQIPSLPVNVTPGEVQKDPGSGTPSDKSTAPSCSSTLIGSNGPDDLIPIDEDKINEPSKSVFFPYLAGLKFLTRSNISQKEIPKWKTKGKETYSKADIDERTANIATSIIRVTTPSDLYVGIEELCQHLYKFPQAKGLAVKGGLVRTLLQYRVLYKTNPSLCMHIQEALTLMGYIDPVKGRGIRILSIDGGGTRGLMALEILRHLENNTNKHVYELFDYICGVSTGAVLAFLLGIQKRSLDETEELYKEISNLIFNQSTIKGTSNLVWGYSYYDTTKWEKLLKEKIGESRLIHLSRDRDSPKVSAVSTVVNHPELFPYVFRTYNLPYKVQSHYLGTSATTAWEAVRASAAAPSFFEGLQLGDFLHQDGGILINNPTALAIHEAKLMWPNTPLQSVISLGTGRYRPLQWNPVSTANLSWKAQFCKIMESATDTQGVHITMSDLLDCDVYHRFNPPLSNELTIDEIRPDKIENMRDDTRMYCRRNKAKILAACETLSQPKTRFQQWKDWLWMTQLTYLK